MKKYFSVLVFILMAFAANSQTIANCTHIQWNEAHDAYSVINYSYNVTFLPVIGIAPNSEILINRTPYSVPAYDPRLKNLVISKDVSADFDSQFPDHRKFETLYTLTDRTIEQKKIEIEKIEADANYSILPLNKQMKYMLLYMVALRLETKGLPVTARRQRLFNYIETKAVRINDNLILSETKKASLDNNEQIDLEIGFENGDNEVE